MKFKSLPVLLFVICTTPYFALLDENRGKRVKADIAVIKQLGGDRLGYADAMAEYLGMKPDYGGESLRERQRISPFDLFSGALAIRESLQLETISQSKIEKPTVNISTLKGPQVKSHQFAQMLKDRKSNTFPLDDNIPPDWFYAHFSSLARALDIGDYLNQTGGAFYNRFNNAPVDTALKKRILHQLAIVENKEARIFYDAVISEVAIVSSDFFFGMGTDVSLIFKLKQKAIFETTLNTYRARFLKEVYGAKKEQVKIEGKDVQFIGSPDNSLRSYFYIEGDFAIVSNSPAALTRLIRIAAKKEPALSASDEFRYMRSVYRADPETEDGFIYFSDAFIRRLVSAEVRIAEARRMETALKLAELEKFALLHQHAYGRPATSLDELMGNVAIDEATVRHLREAFRGLRVNGFRAEHPEMGTLGFLKPNLESGITSVSKTEADGYKQFVEHYSNFWREYFDPIGIRIKKKESGIKIDICILPLIENSIYNQITQLMGGTPPAHTITSMPGETVSLAAKLNLDMLRQFRNADDKKELLDGVSGKVQLHALDSAPTIDFNPDFLFEDLTRGRSRPDLFIGLMAWSLFHPLRLSVEMNNSAAAEGLLESLRGFSQYQSRWQTYDSYDYKYKDKKITVYVLQIARIITFRFHAWADGKTIHVASTRDYAEKFIDAQKMTQTQTGNLVALYRPAQVTHEKTSIIQGNAENIQRGCLAHLGTVKLAALIFPGETAESALQKRYGIKPVCPAGGTYDVKGINPTHSIFGTRAVTHNDLKKIEEIMMDYFSTEEFKLNFQFTPHGIMTSIETK